LIPIAFLHPEIIIRKADYGHAAKYNFLDDAGYEYGTTCKPRSFAENLHQGQMAIIFS
jgi:hypothetical protein